MAKNHFVLEPEQYVRDINPQKHYVDQATRYLHVMTGQPEDVCRAHVQNTLRPGGEFEFVDPAIMYNEREENGDRHRKVGTFMEYLTDSIRKGELIAPTLTTYTNPHVKESFLVRYIDQNVKKRSKAKKEMFAARVAKDTFTAKLKNIEQTNAKLANNAISGAHVSASTPLYNKTAHSTLTSNCRSTSGYGNANNEKFLSGNRHYWSPAIVRNNITSIIDNSDYDAIAHAMQKFGIRHPTVEETMQCIRYSAQLYWRDEFEYERLREYVTRLTDLQRSAFVYTGDMYHLMRLNEEVVRTFLGKLSKRIETPHPDPDFVFKNVFEDVKHLACLLNPQVTKGTSLQKLGEAMDKVAAEGKDPKDTEYFRGIGKVASTADNIYTVIDEYQDLIKAFWVTPNVPASVAWFPDSIRRSALMSDTDSTIFTVQDWVTWYCGRLDMGDFGNSISDTVVFLAAQSIIHVLARMSANFGITTERIHQIAMKNEFKFNVFVPTQVAKHYFALIGAQEGIVFDKFKDEIKGVHLKSSNAPAEINEAAKEMMLDIMNTIIREEKISIVKMLKFQSSIERGIADSIKKGSHQYLRIGQIKTSDSYTKGATESPYAQYLLWNEVFAPTYGDAPPPPYMSVKASTTLDSKAKTNAWLDSLANKELAERMRAWMARNNKQYITTFQLPEQIVASTGIPEEIFQAMDIRKLVMDTTKTLYILQETLGVYMQDDKLTRLVSDFY